MLEKISLAIIRWGTYLVLFTPLIVNKGFFFPFVAPKTIFFRIIVEIILVAYIFLAIKNSKYRPRITFLTLAILLFLEVFILTSLAGISLQRSFWSTYERMTGIFTMLHLYAFFIILFSCFKKREDWEKFLGVSVLTGVLLSLYVLRDLGTSTKGGGTIGNTSFMAAYLLFDVFFALILILANFLKKSAQGGFWQLYAGSSLLVMLPVFFNSSGRGAIFSFWVGIILMLFGYLFFSRQKKLRRLFWLLLLFSLVSGIILIFPARSAPGGLGRYQPDFLKNKVEYALRDMKSRFVVWQIALESFKERPWLGWGPENFHVPFLKYFNPCLFTPQCGGEIWFDRAHNIVLDTLVGMGLLGLLSYLAIFGAVFWRILRTLLKTVEKRELWFPLGLAALLIAYFIQNLLVFDMINTYLVFFLSLAFVGFLTTDIKEAAPEGGEPRPEESGREEIKQRKLNPFLAGLIIIIFSAFIWWGNIQPAMAGYNLVKMLSAPPDKITGYFQKSLDSWMNKYETREIFPQRISQLSFTENREKLFEAVALAEEELAKSVKENPLDFRHHLFLAKLYRSSYQVTGKVEKIQLAQNYAQRAVELAPYFQEGYWVLADVNLMQSKDKEAVNLFEKAVELEPDYNVSQMYLAQVYRFLGYHQLARDKISEIQKMGIISGAEAEDFLKTLTE